MNPHDDPLNDAIAAFRRMPVPDRPPDALVLARLAPPAEAPGPAASPSPLSIRRLCMLPTFRYGLAAAALLVLCGWLALVPSSTPALAEVIRAAEQHRLLRFQSRQTTDDRTTGQTASGTRTVYVDLVAPRVREEERTRTLNDVLDFRYTAVYDYRRDRFLALVSHEQVVTKEQAKNASQAQAVRMVEDQGLARKSAVRSDIARTRTDQIPPMSLIGADHGFLDNLRRLQAHEQTVATRAELDGRAVAKYRLKDGDRTTSLWVDPRTRLPVRMEFAVENPTPRIAHNTWVYTDFVWDPEVADPEQLFSTDPPAGYEVEDHTR